jgi:sulfonate transport system permease protein
MKKSLGLLLPIALVAAAQLAVREGLVPANLLPAPTDVLQTLRELARHGLFVHVAVSCLRVLAGFVTGSALALLIGAAVGLNRRVFALIDPTVQALRAIPSLAWVPLLLLWLGIDEAPKVTLIAIGAFFPSYLGVVSGMHDVDRKLVEVGEIHGLSRGQLIRRIFLPAAMPAVFTGLRGGLGLSWMFLVAAELIAATRGLGYLLTDGRETSRADVMLSALFALAILGKLSDGLLSLVARRNLSWRDSYAERA